MELVFDQDEHPEIGQRQRDSQANPFQEEQGPPPARVAGASGNPAALARLWRTVDDGVSRRFEEPMHNGD